MVSTQCTDVHSPYTVEQSVNKYSMTLQGNIHWVQPPHYLALCGASSKTAHAFSLLTLGICTTTATSFTCKT